LKILNRDRFEGVVMHEMGHAIGYPHIETGPALMAPSGALDFTELDRIACVNHKMCSTL
jgi:predicted Zn-dependent protease